MKCSQKTHIPTKNYSHLYVVVIDENVVGINVYVVVVYTNDVVVNRNVVFVNI